MEKVNKDTLRIVKEQIKQAKKRGEPGFKTTKKDGVTTHQAGATSKPGSYTIIQKGKDVFVK